MELRSRSVLDTPLSRGITSGGAPSQRHRLRLCLNRRQRLASDLGLEGAQSLIDRNQFDDRAPRIDEVLKRVSDLLERVQDLLQYAERNLAGGDRRHQKNVRKDDVS